MTVWFLLITFFSSDEGKVAIYPTQKECEFYVPYVQHEYESNKDVRSIQCVEGKLVKEK